MTKTEHNRLLQSAVAALRSGADAGKLARSLAAQCGVGFARRIVDTASACLWLAEGVPVADVLTMIESRRRFEFSPAEGCAYVLEVLCAAQHHRVHFPRRKEPHDAVA